MLSSLNPEEIQRAILSENVSTIQSVKGIGLKTAQRVIIELRDKVSWINDNEGSDLNSRFSLTQRGRKHLSALGGFGLFSRKQTYKSCR